MRYSSSLAVDWWRERPGAKESTKERFEPQAALADEVVSSARGIERAHSYRSQAIIAAAALYGHSAGLGSVMRTGARPLRENVFAQYTDTWTSLVGKTMPRPTWVPIDGDGDALERAKLLLSYTDSLIDRCGVKSLRYERIRDTALFGLGVLRPYRQRPGGPLAVERIHPINVVMDDVLGSSLPSEIYIRRIVSKHSLLSLYPEAAEYIRRAPGADKTSWLAYRTGVDAVETWEAWHVEPWSETDDIDDYEGRGMHVVCFQGCVLYSESWPISRFPMSIARAIAPTYGYWGNTYYDRLNSIQEELNRQTRMEQEIIHTVALPNFFLPGGSSIAETKVLTDSIGTWSRCTGGTPVLLSPTVSPDIWSRGDRRRAQMAEGYGISQLAATQMKPAGIESAPAFQAYAEFQDNRHAFTLEDDARAMVDFARACVDLERMEARSNPGHRVPCSRSQGGISTYAWPDIDLEESRAALTVTPAGILPTSAAAKIDRVMAMRKAGLIDDQMVFSLLDAPDMHRARSLATAPEEVIMHQLDGIVRGEKPEAPEPWMDLMLARRLWAQRMARAVVDGVKEERIRALREWRISLQELRNRMMGMLISPEKAAEAEAMGFDTNAAMAEQQAKAPAPTPGTGAIPLPIAPGQEEAYVGATMGSA